MHVLTCFEIYISFLHYNLLICYHVAAPCVTVVWSGTYSKDSWAPWCHLWRCNLVAPWKQSPQSAPVKSSMNVWQPALNEHTLVSNFLPSQMKCSGLIFNTEGCVSFVDHVPPSVTDTLIRNEPISHLLTQNKKADNEKNKTYTEA